MWRHRHMGQPLATVTTQWPIVPTGIYGRMMLRLARVQVIAITLRFPLHFRTPVYQHGASLVLIIVVVHRSFTCTKHLWLLCNRDNRKTNCRLLRIYTWQVHAWELVCVLNTQCHMQVKHSQIPNSLGQMSIRYTPVIFSQRKIFSLIFPSIIEHKNATKSIFNARINYAVDCFKLWLKLPVELKTVIYLEHDFNSNW